MTDLSCTVRQGRDYQGTYSCLKVLTLHFRSTTGSKRVIGHEVSRLGSGERSASVHPCIGTQLRNNVLPSHPFIQDPTMPPNPAPSPLIQLEEVRRRLEEEMIKSGTLQPKQRWVGLFHPSSILLSSWFCHWCRVFVHGSLMALLLNN